MDQVVQLELIDVTSIEPCEAIAHVREERPQLTPVIVGDEFSRGSPIRLVR